jgi:putative DNA primase/helicase
MSSLPDLTPEELREWNNKADLSAISRETPGLQMVCMSDVVAKPITWLWPARVALGKVTVLAGDGGMGKSTILCDLAARTTTGDRWPDGVVNEGAGSVVILAAEDAVDDTIKPRLAAAGADMERVYSVSAVREGNGALRSFNLQADIKALEETINTLDDVRLVIIDPISSYLGKVDSHKNADVRSVLEPLGQLAIRSGAAFICNNHFSKGGGGANSRIIGSVAFVNQARAAFIVTADADDPERRLFLPSKMNIAKIGEGLAYRCGGVIAQTDGLEIPTSKVFWESGAVSTSADAALAALAMPKEASAVEDAAEFLRDTLGNGPLTPKEIKEAADGCGISWAAVKRAKGPKDGGLVRARKAGFGDGWIWELAPKMLNSTEDAHVQNVSPFGGVEHLRDEIDDADRPAAYWERSG